MNIIRVLWQTQTLFILGTITVSPNEPTVPEFVLKASGFESE